MAKCKICGKKSEWWVFTFTHGMCPECTSLKARQAAEDLVHELDESPAHCHLVIQEAAIQDFGTLRIGPIFLTSKSMVFVPQAQATGFGGAEGVVGFLLVGVAGGVAASVSQRSRFRDAKKQAMAAFVAQYGMSLEDRLLATGGDAKVIQKSKLKNVTTNRKRSSIRIELVDGMFEVAVADCEKYSQLISEWQSNVLQDQPDEAGANLRYPPAHQLLTALRSTGTVCSESILLKLARDKKYIKAVASVFQLMIPREQLTLISGMAKVPSEFSQALYQSLRCPLQRRRTRSFLVMTILTALVAGIIGLVLMIGVQERNYPNDLALLFIIGILFPLPIAVFAVAEWRQWYRQGCVLHRMQY